MRTKFGYEMLSAIPPKIFIMMMKFGVMFGGRKVDLRTPNDLSGYFRDDVLAEAVYIKS